MRQREVKILAAIVFAGFAARAAILWVGQPEFVGWFNHSTYYWVQVKGLLQYGQLPFADLPMLFILYSGIARLLQVLGMEQAAAIVNTTRFTMSLVPALIALPAYGLVKRIHEGGTLAIRDWVLVGLSAFLPLTLAHMPELLQKNCLGLLFFVGLMFTTQRFLHSRSPRTLIPCLLLFVLIAVTHIGTLAVTLLFCMALVIAIFIEQANLRQIFGWVTLLLACFGFALLAVYLLDVDAFGRVLLYARSSLPDSLLGNLLGTEPAIRRPMAFLGILIPLSIFVYLLRVFRMGRSALQRPERTFWLANTLFLYLLVLPMFDLDLVPRFILFLPLPLLVVLGYFFRIHAGKRLAVVLTSLATVGVAAMLLGEVMGQIFHSPFREEIHSELLDLREQHHLTGNDFVLTRYGVNATCNWFLGTKSGLITVLNKDDFQSYERVFVLNPLAGDMPTAQTSQRTEKKAYQITRGNIPLPADAEPLAQTGHLTFYRLHSPPTSWQFDHDGRWTGFQAE